MPRAVLSSVGDVAATESLVAALRRRVVDGESGESKNWYTSSLINVTKSNPAASGGNRQRGGRGGGGVGGGLDGGGHGRRGGRHGGVVAVQLSQHAPPPLKLALRMQKKALDPHQLQQQLLAQRLAHLPAEAGCCVNRPHR